MRLTTFCFGLTATVIAPVVAHAQSTTATTTTVPDAVPDREPVQDRDPVPPGIADQAIGAMPTSARRALSLDALAADVVAHNPERALYAAQIRSAGVAAVAAGRPADPQLTVEFGQRRTYDGPTGIPNGNGPAYSVALLQPIEFGGRMALRRAIAQRQVDLARLGLQQFDATLGARARELGFTLFAADAKAEASRGVASRMRRLAQVMVQRDPAGPAPELEVAILEAGAITAERNAAMGDAEANAALYELNQLRGAAFPAHIQIIRPSEALPALPSASRIEAAADQGNFELRSLRIQFAQQGLKVDLARKARIPIISAGPYFSHTRADDRETDYGVRAQTTLPIWNAQAADVATEQVRQEQADATLIAAQRRIAREVFQQLAEYDAKRMALDRWPADAPERFARAAAAADANFRTGAIPISTYTDMQNQYLAALSAVLDTRREAQTALNQLRALNGGEAPGVVDQ